MEFYILGGLSFVAPSSTCVISQVNLDARYNKWCQDLFVQAMEEASVWVIWQSLMQMCNIVFLYVHTVALPSVRTVTEISLTL